MHNMRKAAVAPDPLPTDVRVHESARSRWARHATVCLLVACAMVAVMRWWAWAWAPASVIAILYLMYASIEMAEWRSRTLREVSVTGPRPDTHSALIARERIGARILSTLVLGAAAMALIVAALVLDLQTLGIGTAMAFGIVVFVGLPTWAAMVGDGMPQSMRALGRSRPRLEAEQDGRPDAEDEVGDKRGGARVVLRESLPEEEHHDVQPGKLRAAQRQRRLA